MADRAKMTGRIGRADHTRKVNHTNRSDRTRKADHTGSLYATGSMDHNPSCNLQMHVTVKRLALLFRTGKMSPLNLRPKTSYPE
jgi:hypothetical protein